MELLRRLPVLPISTSYRSQNMKFVHHPIRRKFLFYLSLYLFQDNTWYVYPLSKLLVIKIFYLFYFRPFLYFFAAAASCASWISLTVLLSSANSPLNSSRTASTSARRFSIVFFSSSWLDSILPIRLSMSLLIS